MFIIFIAFAFMNFSPTHLPYLIDDIHRVCWQRALLLSLMSFFFLIYTGIGNLRLLCWGGGGGEWSFEACLVPNYKTRFAKYCTCMAILGF